LPAPGDPPRLESVKFSRTKRGFVETELSKRESSQLYSDVVFQVALRTVHELFEADTVRALEEVIFNGSVRALNAGTGHQEDRCILSVRAGRAAFEAINLRNVEPRDVVRSFVGLLNVLQQNPGKTWQDPVGANFMKKADAPASVDEEVALGVAPPAAAAGDLQTFKL
jgi:restriction system protein